MVIAHVKRWHWILISLILGFVTAKVRQVGGGADLSAYPHSMNDQARFEAALLERTNGLPHFKDVVVYPEDVDVGPGPRKRLYVVTGLYYNGRPEENNGQLQRVWRSRSFVADVPYRRYGPSRTPIETYKTVVDYLDRLHRENGVTYSYCWWRESRWSTAVWIGGSFLVIGLIWPTLVNLLAFGSLWRPREDKGIDFSTLAGMPAAARPAPAVEAEDMSDVEEMTLQLEQQLRQSNVENAAVVEPIAGPAPVKQLAATALESPAVEQPGQQMEFGANPDDFYPTERRGKHRSEHA
jgi:hypothetical protein